MAPAIVGPCRDREGPDKKTAATVFVRITATDVGFASGAEARWARPLPWASGTKDFTRYCAEELKHAAGVHRWLVERLS